MAEADPSQWIRNLVYTAVFRWRHLRQKRYYFFSGAWFVKKEIKQLPSHNFVSKIQGSSSLMSSHNLKIFWKVQITRFWMDLMTGLHCIERTWRWIARGVDSDDSAVLLFQLLLAHYRIASDAASSAGAGRGRRRRGSLSIAIFLATTPTQYLNIYVVEKWTYFVIHQFSMVAS